MCLFLAYPCKKQIHIPQKALKPIREILKPQNEKTTQSVKKGRPKKEDKESQNIKSNDDEEDINKDQE